MHDGDDAVEMPRLDVADVRAHVDRGWGDAEIAAVVEHRVETDALAPLVLEHGSRDRPDVAGGTGQEHASHSC